MNSTWEKYQVDEICTLQRGFDLPKRLREAGEYPLVSSSGVIDSHASFKANGPGVVTGRSGSIGNVFYIEDSYWPLNTCLYVKDFHGNEPKFIYYFLEHMDLSRFASGAGVPTLNRNNVHAEKVVLTKSRAEQKRIVAILDEAFASIDQAKANTERNLANARELFESYLTNKMFDLEETWEATTLGKSCSFFNGKAHETCIDENGSYVVVNSKFISTEGRVVKKTNNQLFPLHENDITMVMSDVPKGKALAKCYVVEEDGKYSLNQRICCIRSDQFDIGYLYFQLNRNPYLLEFDNKGSQANLRKADILSCPITFPSLDVQISTRREMFDMRNHIRVLEQTIRSKSDDLQELKQSILKKAFAGELTSNPDKVLNEVGV